MEPGDFAKGQLWAIMPDHLDTTIRVVMSLHASKEFAEKAALYHAGSISKQPLNIIDEVAVIPVTGPISNRATFYSYLFSSASLPDLSRDLDEALADPSVKAILFKIDSPGGLVSGVEAFSARVRKSRNIKPIMAFSDSVMASAAYWIGSAANEIMLDPTATAGSIGVLMQHYDFTKWDENDGLKRTFLSVPEDKALGNDAEPLSDEARKMFTSQLNYIYNVFVESVALNRGVKKEAVLSDMATGRTFIGQQAVDAGLANRLGTFEDAIEHAIALTGTNKNIYHQGGKETKMDDTGIKTVEQLAAAYPELVNQVREQGVTSVDLSAMRSEATQAEKDRILGLVLIQFGEEAGGKFQAIVDTGVSKEQFQAIRIVEPPPESQGDPAMQAMLREIQGAGAPDPGTDGGQSPGVKDFMSMVQEYALAQKVTKTEAMQAIMKQDPASHQAYLKKVNPGLTLQ